MRFFGKKAAAQYLYIVYGARSSVAPEPVIAAVLSEDEALLIESEVTQSHPHAVVRWEMLPIEGSNGKSPNAVSVLFTLVGDAPDADPIAIKAFTNADEARLELSRVQDGLPHEVRTYTPGWRTTEWPFE